MGIRVYNCKFFISSSKLNDEIPIKIEALKCISFYVLALRSDIYENKDILKNANTIKKKYLIVFWRSVNFKNNTNRIEFIALTDD